MLEGLEAVEIKFHLVKSLSNDFRIHSEFFKKNYLNKDRDINLIPSLRLGEIAKIADGDHAKFPDDQLAEVPYLQARDITSNFLEVTSSSFVSNAYFKKNMRSVIKPESILMSIMGTVGDIAITPPNFPPCMCNRALAIIRDIHTLLPEYVFSYLMTDFSKNEIERLRNGGVQQRINLDVLSKLRIPLLSDTLQSKIKSFVLHSHEARADSKRKYAEAEITLLSEIGLKGFTSGSEQVNVKSFKESFGQTGRLDAEYYQQKYECYAQLVTSHHNGFTTIGNEYELIKKISSRNKAQYKYIEIGDVDTADGTASFNFIDTINLPDNAKQEVSQRDLLVSKVRPNRGAITIIDFDAADLLVSGAFTILREKNSSNFLNETLKVLLRTKIYRDWMLKFNIGTQYPVIRDDDILSMPIPQIDSERQIKVSTLVRESLALKSKSKSILETSKHAVEIAIEKDEETALKFLEAVEKQERSITNES